MAKITLYRDENFNWHGYEITNAVAHLNTISITPEGIAGDLYHRVSSFKIESGTWILYEGANFNEDPDSRERFTILGPGDYPNFNNLPIRENQLTSLRPLPSSGICLFTHPNYAGKMLILNGSHSDFMKLDFNDKVSSAIVVSGNWHLYQHITFTGNSWSLLPGRYPTASSGGFPDQTISSAKLDVLTLSSENKGILIPLNGNLIQITGRALKRSAPTQNILFDTGSWTTSLPESWVDSENRTVINEGPVDNGWGDKCRLVKGQLALSSEDGKTLYAVDDFEFYELLNDQGKTIMGAFPSPHPSTKKPSFPYALAKKYADHDHDFGFGFVSEAPTQADGSLLPVSDGWSKLKLYLLLNANNAITGPLQWRTDAKLWHTDLDFCPEAVPGFKIQVSIAGKTEKITSPDYIATIDTGAPDLTLRFDENDPQLKPPFSDFFTNNGPEWWKGGVYATQAKSLENGNVTVIFTDSDGFTQEYTFEAKGWQKSPATLFVGIWEGNVPWTEGTSTPKNRINLGNTVYYYCSVFFYDIKNKRVGFRFR